MDQLRNGERQVAPKIEDIRNDHVSRYVWAEALMPTGASVLDIGCGVGYGASYMHKRGHEVTGLDYSTDALEYAVKHYKGPAYVPTDLREGLKVDPHDAATAFEVLEHLEDPVPVLKAIKAPELFCSAPNEEHFPFQNYAFHHRHYTEDQFRALLSAGGWHVKTMRHQPDHQSAVGMVPGRTLVAHCVRKQALIERHVAILGLGPSLQQFVEITKRIGGAHAYCDEVWGINALGDVMRCERVYHMDDVRVQERRAEHLPESNIAHMTKWLRTHPGPIYTCHLEPGYPGLVAYPLEAVVHNTGMAYFNSTVAYAVAHAIHEGVTRISLFGCDFTYANAHSAEKGRACVEFWVALARARGISVTVPQTSSLMDACEGLQANFYGYRDGNTVSIEPTNAIKLEPKELPTAEEVEREYDHSAHPNPHMAKQ